jgi:hypothetical protein
VSIKIMAQVWADGPTDKAQLLVLLALADFADDSGNCWPSVAAVGQKARMSERNARRIIRDLEEAGFLSVVTGGGRFGCSQYVVRNPDKMSPGQNVPPGQNQHETRTKPARNPDIAMSAEPSRTIKEPSIEPLCISPAENVGGSDRAPRRKPEVPLPEDWVPSDRNLADAESRNFTRQEIDANAEQFRNHHISKGSRFRDWDAAWRTWLGNARKFERSTASRSGPSGGHSTLFAGFHRASGGH